MNGVNPFMNLVENFESFMSIFTYIGQAVWSVASIFIYARNPTSSKWISKKANKVSGNQYVNDYAHDAQSKR